ncbi:DUF962 domain-containing protein [Colwellia hornerae]|uniref:DUF962 domain-containing protein n=1 Tax=Colwellia hornerae TaxID=89402 RepID=A0A5C6QHA3_9GAMM|nr:Mpo1-like protein [Colwellia hornerae]TWX52847.1 DUF962 domain-containing protein [Colwellia hornerae]TWX59201.1 DUF962 domain-containing protein [Colwellia hornerae]TWX68229.1 DUF962 domain-containing protein [Colwellia hornerae]
MKSVVEQLSTYKSVHLNRKNINSHFIGVPMIIWSIALLLASVSFEIDALFINNYLGVEQVNFTLAAILSVTVLFYYLLLSVPLALFAFILFGPLMWSVHEVVNMEHHIIIAISVFVIGWIIQFIGHYYEKAKPAFLDDINQLFIGPLFVIAEIYFLLGLGKILDKSITEKAVAKRRVFEQQKAQ